MTEDLQSRHPSLRRLQSTLSKNQEYEVQEIVGHTYGPTGLFYRIKWVGSPNAENSWEPSDHMGNCQSKLNEYDEGTTQ